MTSPSNSANSSQLCEPELHTATKRVLFYSVLIGALDRRSRALIVDLPEALPYQLAEQAGIDVITVRPRRATTMFPNEMGYWESVRNHQGKEHLMSFDGWLGAREELVKLQRPFLAGLPFNADEKTQFNAATVDETFSRIKRLGWIYINDPEHLLSIIEGARTTLAGSSPVITFPVRLIRSNESTELAACELLRSLGYTIYDDSFEQLVPDTEWDQASKDVIAIKSCTSEKELMPIAATALSERVARIVARSHSQSRVPPSQNDSTSRRPGSVFNSAACSDSGSLIFEIDKLPRSGWFQTEKYGETTHTWSGPHSNATILVPIPGPGIYSLDISIMALNDAIMRNTGFINVFLNDSFSAVLKDSTVRTLKLKHTVPPELGNDSILLTFACSETHKPVDSDKRLGIALQSIELSW